MNAAQFVIGREHNRRIAWRLALAVMALMTMDSVMCKGGSPDPLLASGEQSLLGTYKLDNVLLAPGKLVVLPHSNPLFRDMGDTPEQATQKGLLNARQLEVLNKQNCTMRILADHSFVISNLLSADLTQTFTTKGRWSMQVYHVFDTYGFRISLNCTEYKGPVINVKFFNADKPNPPIVQIFYGDGKKYGVMFRFEHQKSNGSG